MFSQKTKQTKQDKKNKNSSQEWHTTQNHVTGASSRRSIFEYTMNINCVYAKHLALCLILYMAHYMSCKKGVKQERVGSQRHVFSHRFIYLMCFWETMSAKLSCL